MDTETTTRIERVPAERGDRLEALIRGAGDHVERLLDVGTAANGDLLLVLPRPATRLPDLLAVPGWPVAGEAVTLLVPLAAALATLHAAGVAHGGIAPAAVVLDAEGSPALAAPVSPVLRGRSGERAFADAVAADVERFAALAAGVLSRAGVPAVLPPSSDARAVEEALFDVADPVPIRLRPAAAVADPFPLPSRLVAPGPAASADPPPRDRVRGLLAAFRTVRPRTWILAGAALAALAAAAVLLPGGGADATAPAAHRTAAAPRAATPSPAAPGATVPRSAEPIPAVRLLLTARARCLARSDDGCLARFEAAGSPVAADDRAASVAGSAAVRADPEPLRLLARSGSTVTVDARGVTVLAVREHDGWRLRDVVAPR